MRVTIVSDASVCHLTHVAGYGFWAVSERGRHAGGGSFKGTVNGSSDAEMMAIVNALHVTLALGIARAGDQVLIQTDSMHSIHLFTGVCRKRKTLDAFAKMLNSFERLKANHNLTVEFRHIKAHTSDKAKRSRAQAMADQRAKQAMNKARGAQGKKGDEHG